MLLIVTTTDRTGNWQSRSYEVLSVVATTSNTDLSAGVDCKTVFTVKRIYLKVDYLEASMLLIQTTTDRTDNWRYRSH